MIPNKYTWSCDKSKSLGFWWKNVSLRVRSPCFSLLKNVFRLNIDLIHVLKASMELKCLKVKSRPSGFLPPFRCTTTRWKLRPSALAWLQYRYWVLLIPNWVNFCLKVTWVKKIFTCLWNVDQEECREIGIYNGTNNNAAQQYCLAVLSLVEILGKFRNFRHAVICRCVRRKPNGLNLKLPSNLLSIACYK